MYCTRCGKEIRSDQKFCGNCGAKNVNYQEKNDLKEMIEKLSTEEICPQCGKKVNPGSKFCIYCGAALEAPAEQPEEKAEVKVCKACGKPLEEGVVFCTNCGTKIEDDKATEEN